MHATSATIFEQHRAKLFGVAYRMLGTIAEAEDVVQEVYLRWHHSERETVDNPEAFLVTITTRLSIDHLRSVQTQRKAYTGPWLPEPLVDVEQAEPERLVELSDSLSLAFLWLLERLNPVERAVYILREAFGLKYDEVAVILGKSPAHCRQISRRASQRLLQAETRFDSSSAERDLLFQQFLQACAEGNLEQLAGLLAEDATVYSDGGGKVLAALRPLCGRERILRFFKRLFQHRDPDSIVGLCRVNGQPGLEISSGGEIQGVLTLQIAGDKIQRLFAIRNPDKLSRGQFHTPIL